MEFMTGLEGDRYQEVLNGYVTRWFDSEGSVIELPDNDGKGVSYKLKDANPPIPEWYVSPEG
jgi:hypothetical protein